MCINDCIVGVLEFDENKYPQYCQNGDSSCVACQHCMAICPTGALSFGDKVREFIKNNKTIYCSTHCPEGYLNVEQHKIMKL